jgi:hypothetical protein
MPRWAVTCRNCRREFTYTEIVPNAINEVYRDPFKVLPKPVGGKRTCPHCKTESVFETGDLFYREDARGHAS